MMFKKFNRVAQMGLPACALLAVIIVLLGRFWWPGGTSAWASSTRMALLLFLLSWLLSKRWSWPEAQARSLLIMLGLLVAWIMFSVLCFGGQSDIMRRGTVLAVFVGAVAYLASSEEGVARCLAVLKVTACLASIACLLTIMLELEKRGLDFRYRAFRLHSSGIPGFAEFYNPIISGMYMALAGLTAGWCVLYSRRSVFTWMWLLCLAVISLYVFLTYSRSAWLALALGGAVLLLREGRPIHWLCSVVALATVSVLLLMKFPEMYSVEVARGATNRELIWQMVLDEMPGHWLVGHGAGVEMMTMQIPGQTVVNTHSLYLEVLFQYGLVGLSIFVAVLGMTLRLLWRDRSPLATLNLAVLVGAVGVMFFELHSFIHSPNLVWLWIWLPIAVALGFRERRARLQ